VTVRVGVVAVAAAGVGSSDDSRPHLAAFFTQNQRSCHAPEPVLPALVAHSGSSAT
jgi:hypothetical protein